jgi:hypothetical protein
MSRYGVAVPVATNVRDVRCHAARATQECSNCPDMPLAILPNCGDLQPVNEVATRPANHSSLFNSNISPCSIRSAYITYLFVRVNNRRGKLILILNATVLAKRAKLGAISLHSREARRR